MKDVEAVLNELKNGSTLVINGHIGRDMDYYNSYIYNDLGDMEEISVSKVFIRYFNIIRELNDNTYFKLSKNEENNTYLSGIYCEGKLIKEKSSEDSYIFDSINNLNNKLKKIKKIGGVYGK